MNDVEIVRPVLKHWLRSIKPFTKGVAFTLVTYTLSSTIAFVFVPQLMKGLLDSLAAGGTYAFHWFAGIVGVYVLQYTFWSLADYQIVRNQPCIIRALKNDGLAGLLGLDYRFFTGTALGGLVAKLKRYANGSVRVYDEIAFWMIKIIMVLAVSFIVLLIYVPWAALFVIVWTAGFMVYIWLRTKRQSVLDRVVARADSRTTAVMADIITNAPTIVAAASKHDEMQTFMEVTQKETAEQQHAWIYLTHQWVMQRVFMLMLWVGMMGIALYQFGSGAITIGTVVLVQTYVSYTQDAMFGLGRSVMNIRRAFAEAIDMAEILERIPEIRDVAHPSPPGRSATIHFENVNFGYRTKSGVLKDLSLAIPEGQKVGIVGSSGSGKTTLIRLLQRLYDPKEGAIRIGDVDIAAMSQVDLRGLISYVPQEPSLFNRTLRENIAYYKKGATKEEVATVAKAAQIDEFIGGLPDGYDTLVGERGVKLSGGERQRIAIARALLADRPIIIFDEASSALDNHTEHILQKALLEAFEGKTVIVVAHRLSTVAPLDRIIVLHEGRVIEDGSHTELVDASGTYSELWDFHRSLQQT